MGFRITTSENLKFDVMKTINLFLIIFFLINDVVFSQIDKKDVKAKKQLEMAQLIEKGHFRFVAQSAQSNLGIFNNLSANYDMVFDSLHIKAYLPYYGRAYQAKYGNTEGGVKFDLEASKIEKKYNDRKKMFTISTELKDTDEKYSINLTAGLNGFADLKINFLNRQWISYYGTIEKIETQKK